LDKKSNLILTQMLDPLQKTPIGDYCKIGHHALNLVEEAHRPDN